MNAGQITIRFMITAASVLLVLVVDTKVGAAKDLLYALLVRHIIISAHTKKPYQILQQRRAPLAPREGMAAST